MSSRSYPTAWGPRDAAAFIRVPDASTDKHRRGVLNLRTGSSAYPGAAVLGAEAAWRTGIGTLRYVPFVQDQPAGFGLPSPAAAVLAARPETLIVGDDAAFDGRCDAWVIGSGTDAARRSENERDALRRILLGTTPVVVDAGALLELPRLGGARRDHAPAVITPHQGEFVALWQAAGLGERPEAWPSSRTEPEPDAAALAQAARQLASHLGVTVLLKGSLTISATPSGNCTAVGPASPWLAAAGTGDVLAGILGALVATHAAAAQADTEALGALAASAAVLHDRAARIAGGRAAGQPLEAAQSFDSAASAPITALDVALALPQAVASVLG